MYMQHCLQTFRDRDHVRIGHFAIQQDILPNADFPDVLPEVLTGMGLDQKIIDPSARGLINKTNEFNIMYDEAFHILNTLQLELKVGHVR